MSEAYQLASEKAEKNATSGKVQYDKKAKSTSLQPGDCVLIRNVKERGGPGKLRSYWEDKVYKIVRRKSNEIPVYEVIPESGGEKTRVLHSTYLPVENAIVKPAQLKKKKKNPEDEFVPVSVENEAQQSVEEAVQEGATPEELAQESQSATGTTVAAEAETQVDSHPVSSQRVRRPPTRLGYGNLGQPTEHWTSINAVHAPATNNMYLHQYPVLPTPPIPFFPPILPMSLPVFPLYWSSCQGPIMPSNIWC
ncbi:Hypothetical predicted protein [Paramuricea clavata]|uniref:Uncharacterized protein n=1 Tax=Paramuricea clavata TaxID=317549 RepID=A0A6S7JZB6_PARCT|nr:Hypothetical predicted protein [Paramuricea clavata]